MNPWCCPTVSVIIPIHDDDETNQLRSALASILGQEYEGIIEILVADGSPGQHIGWLIRQHYPMVCFVSNPDQIASTGINRAMVVSTGEILVRCDVHATLSPNYIRRAVETLRRTGAANVGGQQRAIGLSFFERAVGIAQTIPLGTGNARYRVGGVEGPTDTVYLGVYRRECLEAVGGFDPSLLRNQDYFLNWRLRQRGEIVWFDPELVVTYRPRRNIQSLMRQYFDYGRWKCEVIRRRPKSLHPRQVVALLLPLGLVASAVGAWLGVPLLLTFPFIYLLTLIGEAVRVGIRSREPAAVLLPLILMVMHLSWGAGFFCPPILKKRSGHIRHPFSAESTARISKPSFLEYDGGSSAGLLIGEMNAGGQQSTVGNGTASIAEAGRCVSVVILTWNSVGKIEPCLDALGQGTQVPDEIIVVDNGSTDQTRAVLAKQYPVVRVIANRHNRGVAQARNQGLVAVRGEYLLVLDDDTAVQPDALARLVSVLDTNPAVAVCGPQLLGGAHQPGDLNPSFPTLWNKVRRWRNSSLKNGNSSGNGTPSGMQNVDYVIGACHLIRRAALDEVGPYDERIFYGPEDIDFCLRLRRAGWQVVSEPAAQVIHTEQRIARSVLSALGRKHATGLLYYFWKHRYGLSRKQLYAYLPTYSPASRSH